MQKADVKDKLDRTGFVCTDLGSGVRVTAWDHKVPGGEIGRKTQVAARRSRKTRASERCHSNA